MSDEEILSLIKEAFCTVFPERAADVGRMSLGSRVLDLAIDSVGFVEIVGNIEDHIGRVFQVEEVQQIRTIGDLAAMIRRTNEKPETG